MQYRQGDVWMEQVSKIPANAKRVAAKDGRYVLAEGEATGHAHTIEEKYGELYELEGVLYFKPATDAPLVHQEHATITLTKPVRIIRQREWSDADEPRQVLD